jgi:hypothetical protein
VGEEERLTRQGVCRDALCAELAVAHTVHSSCLILLLGPITEFGCLSQGKS